MVRLVVLSQNGRSELSNLGGLRQPDSNYWTLWLVHVALIVCGRLIKDTKHEHMILLPTPAAQPLFKGNPEVFSC